MANGRKHGSSFTCLVLVRSFFVIHFCRFLASRRSWRDVAIPEDDGSHHERETAVEGKGGPGPIGSVALLEDGISACRQQQADDATDSDDASPLVRAPGHPPLLRICRKRTSRKDAKIGRSE